MTVVSSNIPLPDPSVMTTDQLRREVGALRDTIETRLTAMDKATALLNDNITRVPTDTDKQITRLRELHDEKFAGANDARRAMAMGIDKQFSERDIRSAASEDAAKVAVNAALQAQKEAAAAQNSSNTAAIAKSEVATTKQIDSILALLASNNSALNDKMAAVNQRLDRGDGVHTGQTGNVTSILAIVAVMASVLGVGIALFNATGRGGGISVAPPATVSAH